MNFLANIIHELLDFIYFIFKYVSQYFVYTFRWSTLSHNGHDFFFLINFHFCAGSSEFLKIEIWKKDKMIHINIISEYIELIFILVNYG